MFFTFTFAKSHNNKTEKKHFFLFCCLCKMWEPVKCERIEAVMDFSNQPNSSFWMAPVRNKMDWWFYLFKRTLCTHSYIFLCCVFMLSIEKINAWNIWFHSIFISKKFRFSLCLLFSTGNASTFNRWIIVSLKLCTLVHVMRFMKNWLKTYSFTGKVKEKKHVESEKTCFIYAIIMPKIVITLNSSVGRICACCTL